MRAANSSTDNGLIATPPSVVSLASGCAATAGEAVADIENVVATAAGIAVGVGWGVGTEVGVLVGIGVDVGAAAGRDVRITPDTAV